MLQVGTSPPCLSCKRTITHQVTRCAHQGRFSLSYCSSCSVAMAFPFPLSAAVQVDCSVLSIATSSSESIFECHWFFYGLMKVIVVLCRNPIELDGRKSQCETRRVVKRPRRATRSTLHRPTTGHGSASSRFLMILNLIYNLRTGHPQTSLG